MRVPPPETNFPRRDLYFQGMHIWLEMTTVLPEKSSGEKSYSSAERRPTLSPLSVKALKQDTAFGPGHNPQPLHYLIRSRTHRLAAAVDIVPTLQHGESGRRLCPGSMNTCAPMKGAPSLSRGCATENTGAASSKARIKIKYLMFLYLLSGQSSPINSFNLLIPHPPFH